MRLAPTRGALSGVLLLILGAWAALVPFFGSAIDLAYTPYPNDTWHWTAARGWLEVLPGAAAFVGGLLLLVSASRMVTSVGAWLGAAAGAWLVVGAPLAGVVHLNPGIPDPTMGTDNRAATAILFFYGIGAAILFVASVAIGRLSVQSLRDVRAAERRMAAAEAAAVAEREANARRDGELRAEAERDMATRDAMRRNAEQRGATHWPAEGDTSGRHVAGPPSTGQPGAAQPGLPAEPHGQPSDPHVPADPAYHEHYVQGG